eukprot:5533221-Alexandrium_andersonii.AAC.1
MPGASWCTSAQLGRKWALSVFVLGGSTLSLLRGWKLERPGSGPSGVPSWTLSGAMGMGSRG